MRCSRWSGLPARMISMRRISTADWTRSPARPNLASTGPGCRAAGLDSYHIDLRGSAGPIALPPTKQAGQTAARGPGSRKVAGAARAADRRARRVHRHRRPDGLGRADPAAEKPTHHRGCSSARDRICGQTQPTRRRSAACELKSRHRQRCHTASWRELKRPARGSSRQHTASLS